jgi:hypothetical protein
MIGDDIMDTVDLREKPDDDIQPTGNYSSKRTAWERELTEGRFP